MGMRWVSFGAALAVLAGVSWYWWNTARTEPRLDAGRACQSDTKACPDGSLSVRSGPDCSFAPCQEEKKSEVGATQPESQSADAGGPSIAAFFEKAFDGRDLTLGRVLERHAAYTRYFVAYRSGELGISGIMNIPHGEGPFPVLILNHGYIDPAIYTNGRGLRREQDYFAQQGFLVFHPDYRNHAQSSQIDEGELENRLGYVEDVINAVYAVRSSSLPYFDKENIGMLGHSMGGGITQTIAVAVPNLVKAVVLYAPVSMDYRDSYYQYMQNDSRRAARIVGRFGDPSRGNPVWDAISPKTYIERWTVPALLFQGTRDESVPKAWSDKTAQLFKDHGKELSYVIFEGEGHEFGPRWGDFMRQSTDFFRKYLKR